MSWHEKKVPVPISHHLAAISQAFFVHDAKVGAAAVVVMLVSSPVYALSGLVASVVARLVAVRLGANRNLVASGLLELNGWFAGLAAATFWSPSLGLLLVACLAGVLTAAAALILDRVLATWDLPLLVAPYVLAFLVLWPALSSLTDASWLSKAAWEVLPPTSSTFELVIIGGVRGLGQIFFCPNPFVGVGLAIGVMLVDWRVGAAMVGASVAGVAAGYVYGAPLWQIEQGLFGFSAALTTAAAFKRYRGFGYGAALASIVVGPLVEMAAIKLAGALGVYALSSGYVVLIWALVLVSPTKAAASSNLPKPPPKSLWAGSVAAGGRHTSY